MYLGPEITVEVTGQRAMAILSRGSLVLNTSIAAEPSTLGGFPGGGGVARDPGGGGLLLSPPSVPPAYPLHSLANGSLEEDGVSSYNVNGPGSASHRYYLFTVTTSADDVDEVQRVSCSRRVGAGGGGGVQTYCTRFSCFRDPPSPPPPPGCAFLFRIFDFCAFACVTVFALAAAAAARYECLCVCRHAVYGVS